MSIPETKGPMNVAVKEASVLDTIRQWWRPTFAAAFVLFFVALSATVLVLIVTGEATISEASDILVTMLGMGGLVTGVYTAGRSAEKWRGAEASRWPQQYEELGD